MSCKKLNLPVPIGTQSFPSPPLLAPCPVYAELKAALPQLNNIEAIDVEIFKWSIPIYPIGIPFSVIIPTTPSIKISDMYFFRFPAFLALSNFTKYFLVVI